MVSDPRKRSKEGVARKEVQEEGSEKDTQEASVVSNNACALMCYDTGCPRKYTFIMNWTRNGGT